VSREEKGEGKCLQRMPEITSKDRHDLLKRTRGLKSRETTTHLKSNLVELTIINGELSEDEFWTKK